MNDRRGFLTKLFGGAAAIPAVKSIERLEMGPKDALVVTVPDAISHETAQRIADVIKEKLPGHDVLVLSGDMTLRVLRRE